MFDSVWMCGCTVSMYFMFIYVCLSVECNSSILNINILAILYILFIYNDHQSLPALITLVFVYAGDVGM